MTENQKGLFRGEQGQNYLFPFILVTSLFFMWGIAHALLDVLNSHFQDILHISKAKSAFIQFALYGGYFVMGIPAGLFIKKFGYKKGIVFGLVIFAIGAFCFVPATMVKTFGAFLVSLFIIACGLTCLEAAANPYVTVLGPANSASRRINFAQSFNGLGWIVGPLLGASFVFSNDDPFGSLAKPYIGIGVVVLIIAILFIFTPMPQIKMQSKNSQAIDQSNQSYKGLLKHPLFIFAVVAQFFYVAAQTGVGSFFINYVIEVMPSITRSEAAQILALGGMTLFMLGRMLGSFVMKYIEAKTMLTFFAAINVLLMIFVILGLGLISIICLVATYLFMSIMYPTIFALGISDLNENTERGSSILVMAVAGGAVVPMLMGYIADHSSMAFGFVVPMLCFAVILLFALCKLKN